MGESKPKQKPAAQAALKPPAPSGGKAKRYRIVSLDGGGIRGIMPAYWLSKLEARLGGHIADHCDLIAGTSTGSILAAAAIERIPMEEIVQMYREQGGDIFPGFAELTVSRVARTFSQGVSAPKYSDEGLGTVLRRQFGETTWGEIAHDKPMLLITSYNTLRREAVVFKTWEPPGDERKYDEVKLWEIVKASCSAPTYFPAHVLKVGALELPLIDGGVVANNPTACAIAEGVRFNDRDDPEHNPDPCKIEHFHVVSLGTGQLTNPIEVDDAREWGALEWAFPIIDVLFDGAADATNYIATQIIPKDQYARFQAPLHEAYDKMDNASAANLNALLNVAQDFLDSSTGKKALETAADLLQ